MKRSAGPRLSIIPARAAIDRALKPRDLQVLCVLGRYTNDLGWCRRSQVKMAEEIGCARSTVFEAIERLVLAGYVERHVREEESGRDSAHVYRVVLDPVHPDPQEVEEDADDEPETTGEAAAPPCRYIGTPAGISAPPAGPEPAPPAGPEPAPINDSTLTTQTNVERERTREDEERQAAHAAALRENERMFRRAFAAWPTFVSDSEPAARKAWDALAPQDRSAAAERQGDYVAMVREVGRSKFCTFGVYLAEQRWLKLAEKPAQAAAAPPSDFAPPFGPVWSAWRLYHMATRPPEPNALGEDRWPLVKALHAKARLRQGHRFGPKFHDRAVTSLMEAVPVDSERWREWKHEHELNGWPWLPDPGAHPVVYFPRGGPPDGMRRLREIIELGVREAAE